MKSKILKYLSKYTEITEQLENAINESAYFTSYKKGDILLKEGDFSNECYFILEGCITSYFIKDGEEKTIDFYTEEEVVTPSNVRLQNDDRGRHYLADKQGEDYS